MYINEKEKTVICKLCFYGPQDVGKQELLNALHDHFAAQFGEQTFIESRRFAPRQELEKGMDTDALNQLVQTAEAAFGAPYHELADSGTLVWLRAVLRIAAPGEYQRSFDVFSATGSAASGALQSYCLDGADAVVFVADGRPERREATEESWRNLHESSYDGPIVLLVNHTHDADELAEALGFEGKAIAEPDGFYGNLEAFEDAAQFAVGKFQTMN